MLRPVAGIPEERYARRFLIPLRGWPEVNRAA
jgi:hypothetical protein